MSESNETSLVQEYRRDFGSGFRPLLLWRDRQAILANPGIAARPSPPLANAPVRFALFLSLMPILVLGWAISALVDLAAPEREHSGLYDSTTAPIVEVLQAEFPGQSWEQIDALSKRVHVRDMPMPAATLAELPRKFLRPGTTQQDPEALRKGMRDWLAQVRTSMLSAEEQQMLLAKALDSARDLGRVNGIINTFTRSAAEGGPLMQVAGVVSLLFAAWLFKQSLTGDARFTHAARADRFFLYYSASRMFWFLPAQAIAYGVGSYASAVGNAALYSSVQVVSTAIALGALLYLLGHSREMARALADVDVAPRGAGLAVAWRIVVAQIVAIVALTVVFILFGIAIGVGAAMLR